jgi:hypothetical protein
MATNTSAETSVLSSEVAYSQSTVGNFFSGCVRVDSWKDEVPYNITIDVYVTTSGHYCSLDNRRLYALRNYGPKEHKINVRIHDFKDTVPRKKLDRTGAGKIFFWWEETNGLVKELHELEVILKYWGLMICHRCAYQSANFSLEGSFDCPELGCRESVTPYFTAEDVADTSDHEIEQMPIADGIKNLLTALNNPKVTVGFSQCSPGNIMHRQDLNTLIIENSEGLQVKNYNKTVNKFLYLKAEGEKDDDYWQDQELHQIECQIMNEIDYRWLEYDIAQVSPLHLSSQNKYSYY